MIYDANAPISVAGVPDTIDCGGQTLDWAAADIDAEAAISGCVQVVG